MTTLVRTATIADATRLAQLGASTFRETFEDENTPVDMASYLSEAFTPNGRRPRSATPPVSCCSRSVQTRQERRTLVGYAHLVLRTPAPPAINSLATQWNSSASM